MRRKLRTIEIVVGLYDKIQEEKKNKSHKIVKDPSAMKSKKKPVGITINEPKIVRIDDNEVEEFVSTIEKLDVYIDGVSIKLDASTIGDDPFKD